jgi:hypothetical protein
MKKPEEMSDGELRERCGIPVGCPNDVVRALLMARIAELTREGIAAVNAAAREQANWSPARKELERQASLQRQNVAT